jgi:hypothetical protein
VKTIEEMRQAHKVLATYSFTPGGVEKGYSNRRLIVDLTANTIEEQPIDLMVKEKFTGGRGKPSNLRPNGAIRRMNSCSPPVP